MARVSLARQLLSDAGLVAAYSPAMVEGHTFENNGRAILHIRNDGLSPVNVTILSGYVKSGLKLADRVIAVAADTSIFVGPFDPTVYNQSDGGAGQVYIDYSSVEGVSIAVLLMP